MRERSVQSLYGGADGLAGMQGGGGGGEGKKKEEGKKGCGCVCRRSMVRTFKSLLHVDCLLCTGLKVRDSAFGLAKGHCSFRRNHALALLDIDLVAENDL